MATIQMVFSDMDGTLLNPAHMLPEQTAQTIREVARKGIPFILASSRPPAGMTPYHAQLGIDSPIISYGGALILHKDEILHSAGIDGGTATQIYALAQELYASISCSAYAASTWFADDTSNPWIAQEAEITSVQPLQADMRTLPESVHKLLCMGPAGDISSLEAQLKQEYPSLSILRSKDTYLEIMHKGVSKAESVRFLCQKYAIDTTNVLSIGDNYNDLDMLRLTGYSAAMGNAPDDIKAQTTHVTLDNRHDGAGAILRKLCLE